MTVFNDFFVQAERKTVRTILWKCYYCPLLYYWCGCKLCSSDENRRSFPWSVDWWVEIDFHCRKENRVKNRNMFHGSWSILWIILWYLHWHIIIDIITYMGYKLSKLYERFLIFTISMIRIFRDSQIQYICFINNELKFDCWGGIKKSHQRRRHIIHFVQLRHRSFQFYWAQNLCTWFFESILHFRLPSTHSSNQSVFWKLFWAPILVVAAYQWQFRPPSS